MPPGSWPRGMRPGQSPAAGLQMRGNNMMGQGQTPDLKRGSDGKSRSSKGYVCISNKCALKVSFLLFYH